MFKNLQSRTFVLLLLISTSSLSACASTSSHQQQRVLAASASGSPCFQGASAGYVRPRLAVGMAGHSVATDKLSIREQPGFNSPVKGSLSPGDTFQVVEGPECKDSYVWWKIDKGQVQGWVGEANPATFNYLLAPDSK